VVRARPTLRGRTLRTILPTLACWLVVSASVSCATGVDSWDDPGGASPDPSPPHASSSGGSSGAGASSSGAGGAGVDAGVGGALADAYGGGGASDDASSGVPDDTGGPDWFTLPTLEAASPEPDAGGDALPGKCASQICFDGFDCLFAGCGTSCVSLRCQ